MTLFYHVLWINQVNAAGQGKGMGTQFSRWVIIRFYETKQGLGFGNSDAAI